MVARRLLKTRKGDLGENLAHYILSALGVAVPVSRQDDYGIDFHCGLVEEKENCVYVESSYLVQIKTTDSKFVSFGGYDSKRKSWRVFEIDWLFAQDNPLLLGFIDRKKQRLRLYSTSIMWLLRNMRGGVGEVKFIRDEATASGGFRERKKVTKPEASCDGFSYDVPLNMPLVDLSVADCKKRALLDNARKLIKINNDTELTNIAYRRLRVHYSRWLAAYKTNNPAIDHRGFHIAWNDAKGANTQEQLQSMAPILATLLSNYAAQGMRPEVKALAEFSRFILAKVHVSSEMAKRIVDCVKWGESKSPRPLRTRGR